MPLSTSADEVADRDAERGHPGSITGRSCVTVLEPIEATSL
jgi:hypothetical protein